MTSIKNTILFVLLALFIFPLIQSCRKGEGDALISLRSRKAKISGEWTIEKWVEEVKYTSHSESNYGWFKSNHYDKKEINNNKISIYAYEEDQNSSVENTLTTNGEGTAITRIVFEKDGIYKKRIEFKDVNIVFEYQNEKFYAIYNEVKEYSGTWNFIGNVEKDYKNKERIVINILDESVKLNYSIDGVHVENTTVHYTYVNGANSEIWQLNTLRNKEIVMTGELSRTRKSEYTELQDNGDTYNSIGNSENTGTINGTLTKF